MGARRSPVAAFYAFTLAWYPRPTSALWILYLLHSGWTLWQVGVAEAGWHVVALLSDLPTGAFADRYGRRLSMAIGIAIGAADPVATYFAAPASVPLGGAAVALGALATTFVAGADRALLYGIASATPAGSASYGRLYGRAVQLSYFAETAGAAAGGLLASRLGWGWPYALAAASQGAALLCLLALPGATPGRAVQGPSRSALGLLRAAIAVLRTDVPLLRLVLFGAAYLLTATLTNLYAQSTLVAKGASIALCTALIAASNLCAGLLSTIGGRLAQASRAVAVLRWGGAELGGLVAVIGLAPLGASALAFLAAKGADGMLDPVLETRLIAQVPEHVRATVLSAPSTGFSLGMIALFPVLGLAMQGGRLAIPYMALGVAFAAAATALLRAPRRAPALQGTEWQARI